MLQTSGITDSHGVTGGVYKTRERIHRGMLIRDYCNSDFMQAGCSLQSELRRFFWVLLRIAALLPSVLRHCSTCVAQDIRGMMI